MMRFIHGAFPTSHADTAGQHDAAENHERGNGEAKTEGHIALRMARFDALTGLANRDGHLATGRRQLPSPAQTPSRPRPPPELSP